MNILNTSVISVNCKQTLIMLMGNLVQSCFLQKRTICVFAVSIEAFIC